MLFSFLVNGLLILLLSSLTFRSWAKTFGTFREVFKHEKINVPRS